MGRDEFMTGLRRALAGKVEYEVIEETVRYYEDYLDTQIRQGKKEEEVLTGLGKPALIAKSIVSASRSGRRNADTPVTVYDEQEENDAKHSRFSRSWLGDQGIRLIMNMPRWLTFLLAGIVLLLVIGFCLTVLSVLAPVLIPLVIVLFVLHLIRNR
ncbi:MAG: DUF1700 domain-containing protein [Lachnospiraceae bacterium]|nr:DUF1700 domain-containing protein [Lachnospiraceae bacterium]